MANGLVSLSMFDILSHGVLLLRLMLQGLGQYHDYVIADCCSR